MDLSRRTKGQLLDELAELRARLEASEIARGKMEAEVQRVLDHTPSLVCVAGLDGYYRRVNSAFERILGYTEEESLSKPFLEFIHPDDRPNARAQMQRLAAGETLLNFEDRNIAKDGSCHWFSWTVIPFPESGLVYGIGHDITARKQAEADLRTAHQELERRVEERTSQLLQTNQRLTEEIRQRSEAEEALQQEHLVLARLLAAHDHERQLIAYEIHDGLAQLLTAAIMQFQAVYYVNDQLSVETTKILDEVRGLLQQSLAESRRLICGVRPPILDEAGVETAIQNLVYEANTGSRPQIIFHAKTGLGRLEPMLENALYRIAQEGLANARRHSKSNRIEVRLIQAGDDRIRVEVQDWGVGFDPQTAPSDRHGLSGIRERARLLGGKAIIHSTPGRGTLVTAELPRHHVRDTRRRPGQAN